MKNKRESIAIMPYVLLVALYFFLAGCSDNEAYETAICTLADISGTYADEKENVAKSIKAGILPAMVPGDSLFFVTIDSNSFNEENLKQKVTLDYRPSYANNQKLTFAKSLDEFASGAERSSHTDISGAMMLCNDYLKRTGASTQLMFIFSDMEEDLEKGVTRTFDEDEFQNVHFAALNVIKLSKDSIDPQVYRDRLRKWEQRLKDAGAAEWQVIFEAAHIPKFIEQSKESSS